MSFIEAIVLVIYTANLVIYFCVLSAIKIGYILTMLGLFQVDSKAIMLLFR